MSSLDPRAVAWRVWRDVTASGAYANLALRARLGEAGLDGRDADFVTELVSGTARAMGTLDAIIEAAASRPLKSLQPAVVDVLRLGAYQWLCMRVPAHAAVDSSVGLAADQIAARVAGVVNAVLRRVTACTWDAWLDVITDGAEPADAMALRLQHPRWIVDALAAVLPPTELELALEADNRAPRPTLAVRPGLLDRDELARQSNGAPTSFSPWGVQIDGDPGSIPAVRDGLAGVQDEGSQLVALAATRAAEASPSKVPWLDLCAGPGGKTALLRGLAGDHLVVAADLQPHRARLVAGNLRAYDPAGHQVVVTDGTRPGLALGGFGLVLVDAPCTGLGSLRRRPEARWRRRPEDVADLTVIQARLLDAALRLVAPDGIVAYTTCSPHPAETTAIVNDAARRTGAIILDAPLLLPEVPDCGSSDPRFVQLWPHRHGTDAMFLALLEAPRSSLPPVENFARTPGTTSEGLANPSPRSGYH